jgi:Flp pilus assembly pilin Flp
MRAHRQGQSTVEWALMLSVLVIAIVAAAYAFVPPVQRAMDSAGAEMASLYTTGDLAR